MFIMNESNVLDSAFLERMKTLLANGEVRREGGIGGRGGQNRSNQFLFFDEYRGINLSEDWVQLLERNLMSKLLLLVPVLLLLFPLP